MKFSIIFDTNVLFVNYDKGGDFTRFYLNATFDNIVEYIEKSDLYENFEILIPEVVWNEMKKQKIEAYTIKKQELEFKEKSKDSKLIFYTKDNIFSEELKNEYRECFKEEIEIVKSEVEILNILKDISKEINNFVYVQSNIEEIEIIKNILVSKEFSKKLLEAISSINPFEDIYIIEDLHDITVIDLKAIEENKDVYEAQLKFNTLFNKPEGNIEDIIEKEESAIIYFMYTDNTIECLSYEYRNISFDEG